MIQFCSQRACPIPLTNVVLTAVHYSWVCSFWTLKHILTFLNSFISACVFWECRNIAKRKFLPSQKSIPLLIFSSYSMGFYESFYGFVLILTIFKLSLFCTFQIHCLVILDHFNYFLTYTNCFVFPIFLSLWILICSGFLSGAEAPVIE